MSTLSNNLQQIYTIKNQIKEVIGTASDVFAEYPAYISAAISGGSSTPESIWLTPNDLSPIFNDPRSYQFPLHLDCVQLFISSDFNVIRDNEENMTSVEFMSDYGISGGQVSIKVIVNDNIDGDLSGAEGLEEAIDEHANDIYGEIRPYLTDCTLSVGDGENEDYILEGKIYAWNLCDNAWGVGEITENGFHLNTDGYVGFNVNVSPALDNMVFDQNRVYYAYSYGIDGWNEVTVNVPVGGSGPSITFATQLSEIDENDYRDNADGWVNGSIDIIDSFSDISYWTGEIYVAGRVPRMRAQNLMRVSGNPMPWYKDEGGVIDSSYAASYAYLIDGYDYLQFSDIGYYRLTTGATEAGASYIYVDSVSAYTTITSVSATDYNGDDVTCTDEGSYFELTLPASDGGTGGSMIYVQLNNENTDPACIAIHNGLELQSTTPHSINCLINPDGGSDFYIAYNQAQSFTLHIPKTTTSGMPENLDDNNSDNYAGTVPVVAAYLASVNF